MINYLDISVIRIVVILVVTECVSLYILRMRHRNYHIYRLLIGCSFIITKYISNTFFCFFFPQKYRRSEQIYSDMLLWALVTIALVWNRIASRWAIIFSPPITPRAEYVIFDYIFERWCNNIERTADINRFLRRTFCGDILVMRVCRVPDRLNIITFCYRFLVKNIRSNNISYFWTQ